MSATYLDYLALHQAVLQDEAKDIARYMNDKEYSSLTSEDMQCLQIALSNVCAANQVLELLRLRHPERG